MSRVRPVTEPDALVDTSVAVALVVADHEFHSHVIESVRGLTLGLAGHAAFETYSVLTRMPAPIRRPPAVVADLLRRNFLASRFLGAAATRRTLQELADLGVAGGSVYDALVAATAREHHTTLLTRDVRAIDTYRAFGIALRVL